MLRISAAKEPLRGESNNEQLYLLRKGDTVSSVQDDSGSDTIGVDTESSGGARLCAGPLVGLLPGLPAVLGELAGRVGVLGLS